MTVRLDEGWPSLEQVILPSRALLLSWLDQTLPARRAALVDAVTHAEGVAEGPATAGRDMAILGVVHEAMQPLEDFAYLATAWTDPFKDLAHYVRATVWSGRTPTNFWQNASKRDDAYLDVLAGFRSALGDDDDRDVLRRLGAEEQFGPEVLAALKEARRATRDKLRMLLPVLADSWRQFADYFYAYKHGGLIVNRGDTYWHDADADEDTSEETRREQPSLAVWLRGGKTIEGRGEFGLHVQQIVREAAGPAHIALRLVEAFIRSRVAVFDAVEFAGDGQVAGLKPMQMPWTVWLAEGELPAETWALIGAGPRITWVGELPPGLG